MRAWKWLVTLSVESLEWAGEDELARWVRRHPPLTALLYLPGLLLLLALGFQLGGGR